jgi:lipopolysaccharide/colanic/teichoic acid biosynthesis glycosyltransferase
LGANAQVVEVNRTADIAIATVATLVAAPVMLLAAGAIRVAEGAPVVFRQVRVGMHGRSFVILKFRTMRVAASADGFDAGDRRRVTRVGALLRATKIDELPQLINVLRGDMSIVGPRPEVPAHVDLSDPRWREVLARRPGLTDWASVEYFTEERELALSADPARTYREEVLPRKLELQLRYVRDPSPGADASILWLTAKRILVGR